jgi:predicted phosphodiesterase
MKHPAILLLLGVILLISSAASSVENGVTPILVRGPYLTPAGEDALAVHVWTSSPVDAVVEFGEESGVLLTGNYSRKAASTTPSEHQRIILPNLTPGTRYRYHVLYGEESTGDLHFLTCPERGPVTFLVMGDSRDQPPEILQEERFGAVSGRAATEAGILFVVHTGDFVLDGNREEDWDRFFRIGGVLLGNTTLLPVRGNHDGPTERFTELFGVPANYSFTCGDIQVAVLDSGDDAWQDLPAQVFWLDRALGQGPPVRFAALHYPLFSSDERHFGGWENLRNAFVPVLSRQGIRAVFQGHVHLYERDQAGGIQYITDARGGAPPYRFGGGTIPEYENGLQDSLGYSRIRVPSPDLPAILEVIRVADLRDGEVVLQPPGVVVERVRLPAPANGTPGPGSAHDSFSQHALFAREIDLLTGFLSSSPG